MAPTIETANKQIAQVNKTAGELGLNSNIPQIGDVISQSSLKAQPSFDLKPQDTDIRTDKVDQFVQEQGTDAKFRKEKQDALLSQVSQQKQQASVATDTSFDDYINSVLNTPTFSELQAQEYSRLGVDEKQLRVDQLDTQLLSEQDALRTKIERIQREGGGLKIGAQSDMANLERESLAKQADIALLQLAAQDQLDYSTRVADRAVQGMFERAEKIEGVRKEIYERNKSIFDKNEQREFEIMLADRERELQAEKEAAKLLLDTKIEALKMMTTNNAPASLQAAVMASQTPEEVIATAGQYGTVDLLERAVKQQQYSNAVVAGQIQQKELNLLNNPPITNLSPELEKKITGLSDGKRNDLTNARQTIEEVDRMIELVRTTGDMSLLTKGTEQGREFLRLRADVTDRLARQRTGAVVGKDEEATFKDILGIGVFNLISSDDEQVIEGLELFKQVHTNNVNLIDPTGEIGGFLDARSLPTSDSNEIDAIWGISTSNQQQGFDPSNYFNN